MGGHLVEFDTIEESQDVIAGLMSDSKLKGKNFWTGGINPGLLWVWPTSGRPVDQNTKQPVIGGRGFVLFIILPYLWIWIILYFHVKIYKINLNIKYKSNFSN